MMWPKKTSRDYKLVPEAGRARRARDRVKLMAASMVCVIAVTVSLVGLTDTFGTFTARVNNSMNSVSTDIYSCATLMNDARSIIGLDAYNATLAGGVPNVGSYAGAATINQGPSRTVTVNRGVGPCPHDSGYLTFNNGTTAGAVSGAAFVLYSPQKKIPRTVLAGDTTQILWFRTSAVRSGALMMMGTQFTTSANSATLTGQRDHIIALTNTGQVAFGVFTGTVNPVISPASYTDGLWHQVIATASNTDGITLYIDGVQVGANATRKPQLSEWAATTSADGYLYLGYHLISPWGFSVTTHGYTGDMSMPTVLNAALTPAEVAQWYARSKI